MKTSEEIGGLATRFAHYVSDPTHPCAMAKAVVNQGTVDYGRFGPLGTVEAAEATCRGLYESLRTPRGTEYWSYVAFFPQDEIPSEERFESLLWSHLQRMHDFDATLHTWDRAVSAEPGDAKFSFSVGGRAFYVIGLHPQSSRYARQLDSVALVFNPHGQFDALRERGKYATVRDQIRKRDERLQGSINPMLADHGDASEARQYSGRAVGEGWRCPLHAAPQALS